MDKTNKEYVAWLIEKDFAEKRTAFLESAIAGLPAGDMAELGKEYRESYFLRKDFAAEFADGDNMGEQTGGGEDTGGETESKGDED